MRTIVLHYHLFKNAGTSIDSIFKDHFADAWVTAEFLANGGDNSDLVAQWIQSTPDAVVFSSHTAIGPLPEIPGVRVIPVLFLRDPIARIISAYNFERKQAVDTLGTQLARENDLEGYVRARLDRKGDRQCRNFQTNRLAAFLPGPDSELDRARRAMSMLHEKGVLGLVENFGESLEALNQRMAEIAPWFRASRVRKNVSGKSGTDWSAEFETLVRAANADDLELVAEARPLIAVPS
ncbi:sulfotransferase family protein [Mesobacterium pallidum]|uniref:sulfotransferase family protein n=1 Tax=Mesobacterium pallidum TaxID=2872037 RepID=UPI001EE2F1AE|nr:sulfotransferase family protein [Mesobacterium pallidum]